MKNPIHTFLLIAGLFGLTLPSSARSVEANPNIDYAGFREEIQKMETPREQTRLSEKDFLEALQSGDYLLLDARSREMFKRLHIEGAVNLPFSEFTEDSLKEIISSPETPILIYCNNNFDGPSPAIQTKSVRASLNLNTQASLRAYGYRNIHELGPYLKVSETILPLTGEDVSEGANSPPAK